MSSLLWFRNDLRINDNPALHHFLATCNQQEGGKAIFFISHQQWQQHDWSAIKIDFLLRHAKEMVKQLAKVNIELELIEVDDFRAQEQYLTDYCSRHHINKVYANNELEVNEHQRDLNCIAAGVPLVLFEADVIVPKGKLVNNSGTMYKVFTPFKKAWLTYVRDYGFDYLGRAIVNESASSNTSSQQQVQKHLSSASSAWPLASEFEYQQLPSFLANKLAGYASQRDFPAIKGTSGISAYLANGVISPRYVLFLLVNKYPDIFTATDSESFAWLNELIWREFYRHLMFAEPRLCKHQSFKEKYQHTQWHNNPVWFQSWCDGKTGYPLVDAAMNQLKKTGWMHNRLRMVVASFLTKHLLIDWRWGERYFMQQLIDGDLAANNGGWQWAASTGCDAQPYFRIFNPINQSKRFDPDGDFIRKYLPELENIPAQHIHFPHQYIAENKLDVYVQPIVEHKQARLTALAFYK